MYLDRPACERAVASRDRRFDGLFITAVTTTGIYCRPSCPAMTPKPAHMRFFPTAAAAHEAGFRACRRCRPDTTPGSPEWDTRGDAVGRAMRLIADGVVDRAGVPGLAASLGYSPRHLQRLLREEVGAGPVALARSQRASAARTLLETTDLPIADVAFAAGFGSIRSLNDTLRTVFALTPHELRARRAASTPTPGTLTLRLPFRPPLVPDTLVGHLAAAAVPGVEEWAGGAYCRTLRLPHGPATAALRLHPDHVVATVRLADLRDLPAAVARLRRTLDLDADPDAVAAHLSQDPALAEAVAAAPGRRVPRTADPDEFAIRAVLGQQVSTAAARTHAARLVAAHGTPLAAPDGGLTHLFPTPAVIAGLAPADFAIPARRAATVLALAAALADGTVDLSPGADRAAARAALAALPGIGPWTIETIAMRSLGEPDAFPATDLGVRHGAVAMGVPDPLERAAEAWRPWRSYATQYLWAAHDHPATRMPTSTGATTTRTPATPQEAVS